VTGWPAAALGGLGAGGVLLVVAGLRGPAAGHAPRPRAGRGFPARWRSARVARWRAAWSTPARRVLLGVAAAGGVAGYAATGVPAVGLLLAAAVPGLPWLWSVGRDEERAIARMEALADWTRRLKDQLSTGAGLVSAVGATAATAPEVAPAVAVLAARLRSGTDPEAALRGYAADLDDPVADQVVAALLLHLRDRGPHLAELLSAVAADTSAQVAMRREVHAKRTQPRHTVRFMTVFGVVIALVLVRGELLAAYATPAGQVVLVLLVAAFAATLAWVRSMSQPPPRPRFLDERT
jgi:Flp pilus assembly protein TadB